MCEQTASCCGIIQECLFSLAIEMASSEYRLVQNEMKHLCECKRADCAYRKRERQAVK